MVKKNNRKKDPRVFLGFGQPPLVSATEYLCRRFRKDNMLDLSHCLIVLPTSRAVQRLLQLLVIQSEQQGLVFTPAQILTVSEFPEYLYPIEKKLATDLCQQIAWGKALAKSEPEELRCLFSLSEKLTFHQWQPYAKLISELHKRLGNDVWSFSSVVREVLEYDKNFREIDRWRALQAIQSRYYKILGEVDLWDKQAARNVAVKRGLCSTDKTVILLGLADLNRATKLMLEQIRDRVTVLVAAPRNMECRFDEFGGIITEQWLHSEIKFSSEQLRIVDSSEDQAFAVAHYLQQLNGRFSADQITVGIPDPDVQPQVERSLKSIEVQHRDLKGKQVKHTPPVKLMVAMLEFLGLQNFTTYAALVRHPDMFRWVSEQVDSKQWLNFLDDYQVNGLPDRIEIGARLPFGNPDKIRKQYQDVERLAERFARQTELLNLVFERISKLFEVVVGEPRPIAEWTQPWCSVLTEIYGSRILDKNNFADQQTIVACREIYSALRDKQQVPVGWVTDSSAHEALQMAIEAASDWTVVPPPVADAVELSGWLDLPLDDAAVVIVTGMNDEHVPTSENGHLFLPNRLCTELGILDNDRRYARDAYSMTVIKSVREHALFIAGRRDLQGEPKKPSRLLFADDNETIAKRANAFFAYEGKADSRYWLADPAHCHQSQQLPIPEPEISEPLTELSVTSFKEFLKCPYRFYLGKILRLESVDDDWQEMDGRAFGNLAHLVLEDFGHHKIRNAASESAILEFLNDQLDSRSKEMYGGFRLPAVRIQIEQLRMRLARFAPLQAQMVADGWRIANAEEKVLHKLMVDGQEFIVKGTIDRIDIQESTGKIAVWDYKTSDQGDDPTTMHLRHGEWKDLQLPLYRKLITEIDCLKGKDLENVQLGYVQLPKQLDKVSFTTLRCTPDQLEDADRLVADIIRKIRMGLFWPPKRKAPQFSEAFAGICQDNAFERFNIEAMEASS